MFNNVRISTAACWSPFLKDGGRVSRVHSSIIRDGGSYPRRCAPLPTHQSRRLDSVQANPSSPQTSLVSMSGSGLGCVETFCRKCRSVAVGPLAAFIGARLDQVALEGSKPGQYGDQQLAPSPDAAIQ